jgi:hypothetical protein
MPSDPVLGFDEAERDEFASGRVLGFSFDRAVGDEGL